MNQKKRVIRIETSLTPLSAVQLHLRRHCHGKTSMEYYRWLSQLPPDATPKTRIYRELASAISSAMKYESPDVGRRAVRQGQREADYLLVLFQETNSMIRTGIPPLQLRIGALFQYFSCSCPGRLPHEMEEEDAALTVQSLFREVLALNLAADRIRDRYFGGENILFKDAQEALRVPTVFAEGMQRGLYESLVEIGYPEVATDPQKNQEMINERAEHVISYLVALAKSSSLRDFGEIWEARKILKPFIAEYFRETGPPRQ